MIYSVSFIDPKNTQITHVRASTTDEAIERAAAKIWGATAHFYRDASLPGLYGQVEYGRHRALTPRMRVESAAKRQTTTTRADVDSPAPVTTTGE